MTVKQVADYCKKSRITILRWIKEGKLPATRGNKQSSIAWEIDKKDVDTLLKVINYK